MDYSMSTQMRSAMIPSPKAQFGAKTKKSGLKTKKWTMAGDDKNDKSRGIKENSPTDTKLDVKRGLSETFAKLRGGK